MVDFVTVITVIVSVATSTASLAYWLGRKFTEIDARFGSIEARVTSMEGRITSIEAKISQVKGRLASLGSEVVELKGRIGRLENAFMQFSEVLISTLEVKGVFTATEAAAFKGMVRVLLSIPGTRYYTWEVYGGLGSYLIRTRIITQWLILSK